MSAFEGDQTTAATASPRSLRAVPDPAPEATSVPEGDPEDSGLSEPDEEIPEVDPSIRPRSLRERWVSWVLARVTVPHLITEDRPALRKLWRYARYCEQLPPAGALRLGGLAYLYAVALPVVTGAYIAAWLAERPARAGIAAVLLGLARLWEPTHLVLTVVLAPLQFVLFLLTG